LHDVRAKEHIYKTINKNKSKIQNGGGTIGSILKSSYSSMIKNPKRKTDIYECMIENMQGGKSEILEAGTIELEGD